METNSFKDSFANEAFLSPTVGVELLPTTTAFFGLSQRGTFTLCEWTATLHELCSNIQLRAGWDLSRERKLQFTLTICSKASPPPTPWFCPKQQSMPFPLLAAWTYCSLQLLPILPPGTCAAHFLLLWPSSHAYTASTYVCLPWALHQKETG